MPTNARVARPHNADPPRARSGLIKYSDLVVQWLQELGYTHCFFVAGGNIMHLLDGVRQRMTCIPTVHEVAAGIAAEYFNETEPEGKAFVLVTAGPGMTNVVTAMAGAWLESRELLVIGGQVKSADLNRGEVRQRGIQEVDGREIAAPVCVTAVRIEQPIDRTEFTQLVQSTTAGRKGPVFIEVCLDVQGAPIQGERELGNANEHPTTRKTPAISGEVEALITALRTAERPVLLLGGGVSRKTAREALPALRARGIPVMTTWNGMDRFGSEEALYMGRPDTWGQRSANVLLQQADLVVALGARLGMQQTGFNWQEFAPLAKVVQVEIDDAELRKGHPRVDIPILGDVTEVLPAILAGDGPDISAWVSFCRRVRELLPLAEEVNTHADGYLDPYEVVLALSNACKPHDVFIPCSSGTAFSVSMQAFRQKSGQICISNRALASMGYGLSGAIGAAVALPDRRTVLVEGDGGFAQNMQELGTVVVNKLNLKTFLFLNEGYASIRMTQRNYFDGEYLGCDTRTGLGFPDWAALFDAFDVPSLTLADGWPADPRFIELFDAPGPAAFIVPVDPEQTYFPKIASRVTSTGNMESSPLHCMSPDLRADIAHEVFRYIET